jgi:hypothetical protein
MNFPSDGSYFLGYSIIRDNMPVYAFNIKDGKIVIGNGVLDQLYSSCVEWIIYNGDWDYDKKRKWLLIKIND